MEEPPPETLVEEREALMVSPLGGKETLRTAHFLKPSSASIDDIHPFSLPPNPNFASIKKTRLEIKFRCPKIPLKNWETWVNHLLPTHRHIWEKAGIFEAIMASKYQIMRRKELIIALAERWNPETNTFIFPWGESTVTLEDMRVLGGYSALGQPIFTPLKTKDLIMVEESLCKSRREIRRLGDANCATQSAWMEHFMDSGNNFEHEAFLALWLIRYVLPTTYEYVSTSVFPVAIHLSRGTPIALAPAVLASIYRDLSLLKKSITSSMNLGGSKKESGKLTLEMWAPFQLVQVWAWERFPTLRPIPNLIILGEPRFALWHRVTYLKVDDERRELDSAGNRFQWRPYAAAVKNWGFGQFYGEKNDVWAPIEPNMDRDLIALPLCMRPSELVGLDCIEQYLPHRVSMQFGIDQDLPGHVPRLADWDLSNNESFKAAWEYYCRLVRDTKLYIPARCFEPKVTTRYFSWRASPGLAYKHCSRKRKILPQVCGDNEVNDQALNSSDVVEDEEDNLTIGELLNHVKKKMTINDGLTRHDKPSLRSSSLLPPEGLQEQDCGRMEALNQITQGDISIEDPDKNELRKNKNGEEQGNGLKGDGKSICGCSSSEVLQKEDLGREKDLVSIEDANINELNGKEKGINGLTGEDRAIGGSSPSSSFKGLAKGDLNNLDETNQDNISIEDRAICGSSPSSSFKGLAKGDLGRMNNLDETNQDNISIEDRAICGSSPSSSFKGLAKGDLGRMNNLDETNQDNISIEDRTICGSSPSSSFKGLAKGELGRMKNLDKTNQDNISTEDNAGITELDSSLEKMKENGEGSSMTSELRRLRLEVEARVTKLENLVEWLNAGNLDSGQSDNPVIV